MKLGAGLQALLAEILRRLGVEPGTEAAGLVREAVEDALEGRRPRW